jgi:hypothetical protein
MNNIIVTKDSAPVIFDGRIAFGYFIQRILPSKEIIDLGIIYIPITDLYDVKSETDLVASVSQQILQLVENNKG